MDLGKLAAAQNSLAKKVILCDAFRKIKTIAGVDCAVAGEKIAAGIVVLSYPKCEALEKAHAVRKISFPYIAGFLAYREAPAILAAYKKLKIAPDVLVMDAQGIAHPRRIGLASHIGVLLNTPTIGVAKSRLVGEYDRRKKIAPLFYEGGQVGWVLNKKLFISPGHKVSIKSSLRIIENCARLPTKIAHEYVNEVAKC